MMATAMVALTTKAMVTVMVSIMVARVWGNRKIVGKMVVELIAKMFIKMVV